MKQDEEIRKEQGERLRIARESLGIKQAEAARRLQIGSSGLNDVEKGKNNLSTAMSRKVAQFLGINPAWVLTGEGEMMLSGQEQMNAAFQNNIVRPIRALREHYAETVARITGSTKEKVLEELKEKEDELLL